MGLELTGERYFIGLNLGVRQSHAGAVTAGGRLLAEATFDTPGGAEEALRLMRSTVADLRSRVRGKVLYSLGVSVPGPTCAERRRLLYAPHLGWRDVDVAAALDSEHFTRDDARANGEAHVNNVVPVVVENDARAAALYEARARSAEEGGGAWRDFILVRAGTGVGVGVVRGGEVYRGSDASGGWAGEFGHMTIVADGRRCACGGRGCWEAYASTGSAVALYTNERAAWKGRAPRFVEIVSRAEAGEVRARSTLERVGGYLGIGVANLISGLGVSRVVVSGRLVHGWKFMRGPLHEAVGRSMAGRLSEWTVVPGRATGAGLGGALEVAIDHYLTAAARTTPIT
jgi:glucokinase